MRDYIDIGPCPAGEDCAQVGASDYYDRYKKEMTAYINQIRRELGPEPPGARLRIKANAHDFGTYHDVIVEFDPDDEEASNYAYKCERTNENWDEEARKELGLDG